MTDIEKKVMRKNAELGFDETETLKAQEISDGVHKEFTTDDECAILRKSISVIIGLLKGTMSMDDAALVLAEFGHYDGYVERVKTRVKEDIGGKYD